MLNAIIRFSLQNRLLILAASAFLVVYGSYVMVNLPIDVLPDINRPVVTIMTESHGLAPEEVERLVTFPLETLLNGATTVERVRSVSGPGLSIIFVEFGWDTDIYIARQIVNERLQLASTQLPPAVLPVMGPISSIMGGIHLISLRAEAGAISELDLRTLADWTIRPRLLAIPGVAQVINLGGGVKQYQVLVNPQRMRDFSTSLAEVEQAIAFSNSSTTGGFVNRGGQEFLIRNMGRIQTLDDLRDTVVALRGSVPVYLRDIARVEFGPQVKRGEAAYNGQHSVIMQITKQPGANTLELTEQVEAALDEIRSGLPEGVVVDPAVFRQADFISTAVGNVVEALRDASILVVIIMFLFLLNFRTTTITLTAIPMSFLITAVMMRMFGISINTMMLGGLAIAIGELVDDAIVGMENVFRRLRENRQKPQPEPALTIVFRASSEIRNSIVYATFIVILVFLPLFFLGGVEGRLFTPLGIAYVVSILASLLVSLTLTPVLCYYLLGRSRILERKGDGWLVRQLKRGQSALLDLTLEHPGKVILAASLLVLLAIAAVFSPQVGRAFLPGFNEGSYTINVLAEPGTSLPRSDQIGAQAERLLLEVPEVQSTGRRTGRAELDEHAEGVHYTEIEVTLAPGRPKEEIESEIREKLDQIPNVEVNVGQPISHRIDHLLSGTFAAIAVKIFGEDLTVLRRLAEEVEQVMGSTAGVEDLYIEKQVDIPQVRIQVHRTVAARYGLGVGEITEALETALNGRAITQVLEEQRSFDVFLRLDHYWRDNLEFLDDLLVDLPTGGKIPLAQVASIEMKTGPNQILRENGLRRMVVQCNVAGRDLGSTVEEIRDKVTAQVDLPEGYFVSYGGQFESQVEATQLILLLSIISIAAIFVLLYGHFQRASIALQIMLTLPLSFIGAVGAILWTDRILSVASLVGFITLLGIAARNGIMMISHYLHLMQYEGEVFDKKMIVRGTLERLVPVMMTALTTALGLVPLALAQGVAGREILYPVAVVILGGLLSSTVLNMVVIPSIFFKFGRSAYEYGLPVRLEGEEIEPETPIDPVEPLTPES
ncbi:efflux RND transporter permease subunit [Acidobacteria bacterium AH-259-D05]|nr:efflux RND transporter permease subunit [Acidobacteria bacterium AH-259-D05]